MLDVAMVALVMWDEVLALMTRERVAQALGVLPDWPEARRQ